MDLQNPIQIPGFDSIGSGTILVKRIKMMPKGHGFVLSFAKDNGVNYTFCVAGEEAKILAAFLILHS